jgi:hypothetical protein
VNRTRVARGRATRTIEIASSTDRLEDSRRTVVRVFVPTVGKQPRCRSWPECRTSAHGDPDDRPRDRDDDHPLRPRPAAKEGGRPRCCWESNPPQRLRKAGPQRYPRQRLENLARPLVRLLSVIANRLPLTRLRSSSNGEATFRGPFRRRRGDARSGLEERGFPDDRHSRERSPSPSNQPDTLSRSLPPPLLRGCEWDACIEPTMR